MGNRIRGITVEIGGDTTKLDKALAGTNKELSATQKALKDVERLLKLDPGNTELLAQKEKLLGQVVEETAQKLETLREAASSADQALQRNNDYTERYAPLREELERVSASMRGLEANEQSMREKLEQGKISAEQYDAFSNKLKETRECHEELRQAVRDLNKEFSGAKMDQRQYDALQREIAETERQLEDLGEEAEEASASLGKIEAAAGKVADGAGKVRDATAPITRGVTALAAAAIATVPATEELRSNLSKLENNARQCGVGMDVAKDAFQTFNVVSDETDSSVEATANLLQAGFTESNLQKAVEGLAGAYLAFPDTLKIESLADSLQETLATGSATGQFGELLDRLGVGADKFSQELSMCVTEIGRQDLALGVLAQNGMMDYYEGWIQGNEAMLENKQANLDLQLEMAELAEKVQPLLTMVVDLAAGMLDWFNGLDESGQRAVVAVLALIAAISPMAGIVGSVSKVLPSLIGLMGDLNLKTIGVSVAFMAIASLAGMVVAAWDDMSGLERAVAVLGLLSAAALAAAVAVGAFQSAVSMGLAVAGIVAGIAMVTAAIASATNQAKYASNSIQGMGGTKGGERSIPMLADGGLAMPNSPFLAVLGDNRKEVEVVSPYSTIKKAAGEAMEEHGGGQQGMATANLYLNGTKVGRAIFPFIQGEATRQGIHLTGGGRVW